MRYNKSTIKRTAQKGAKALEEFGQDGTDVLKEGAEAMDVTIRCYLLGQAIAAVLDDLEEEDGAFEEEEEEEEED